MSGRRSRRAVFGSPGWARHKLLRRFCVAFVHVYVSAVMHLIGNDILGLKLPASTSSHDLLAGSCGAACQCAVRAVVQRTAYLAVFISPLHAIFSFARPDMSGRRSRRAVFGSPGWARHKLLRRFCVAFVHVYVSAVLLHCNTCAVAHGRVLGGVHRAAVSRHAAPAACPRAGLLRAWKLFSGFLSGAGGRVFRSCGASLSAQGCTGVRRATRQASSGINYVPMCVYSLMGVYATGPALLARCREASRAQQQAGGRLAAVPPARPAEAVHSVRCRARGGNPVASAGVSAAAATAAATTRTARSAETPVRRLGSGARGGGRYARSASDEQTTDTDEKAIAAPCERQLHMYVNQLCSRSSTTMPRRTHRQPGRQLQSVAWVKHSCRDGQRAHVVHHRPVENQIESA